MDYQEEFNQRQQALIQEFAPCTSQEGIYNKIIEIGQHTTKLSADKQRPQDLINGCQSIMYLSSHTENGKLYFEASSDALISFGLAAILIRIYSGLAPEALLKCPPNCLDGIGIRQNLTPGRSNGLAALFTRMQKDALAALMRQP